MTTVADKPAPPDAAETVRTAVFAITVDRGEMTRAQGADDDGIPITISSEFPVERYDFWEGERYLEVLEHSTAAIDLSRASTGLDGLPFVDTHNIYTVRAVLGRVRGIHLRADGKLAGRLHLSQRQDARDYRADLEAGIVGEVSVGYRIDPARVDRVTQDGELPRYIVRRWAPHEVSAAPVPADPTVGANRTLAEPPAGALPRPYVRTVPVVSVSPTLSTTTTATAPTGQEIRMDPVNTAPDTGATPTTTPAAPVVVTRTEAPDLAVRRRALAAQAKQHGVEDVFVAGDAAGDDLDKIGARMMAALKERADKGPQFGAPVALTDKEQQRYSVSRAMLAAAAGEKCFEADVSEQIQRSLPQGYSSKGTGVFVPTNLNYVPSEAQRAAMVTGTSALGGALTFVVPGSFIDLLRNKTFVLQAGARLLPGLRSSVSFPKQTGAGTFYWVGENPGSDVNESNMTFGLVSLTPKTGAATQAFSRQLLLQAEFVPEIEMHVRNELAAIHARAIDRAAIWGAGNSNEPLGIGRSTNIGTATLGAHGAVPTYEAFVDIETSIATGNVDGAVSHLTTPGIAGRLKKTQKFATTTGEAVWTGNLIAGTVNGGKAFATNQVPSNLTKGTSTTVCHAIISGVFQHLMIGEFGAMEIITDELTKKKQGLIEVTSFQMADVAWQYDEAFKLILDAKVS